MQTVVSDFGWSIFGLFMVGLGLAMLGAVIFGACAGLARRWRHRG